MTTRGNDNTLRAFISKTGVPIYFDEDGNFRPEGPQNNETNSSSSQSDSSETDTSLHPLYFITANVHTLRITSV